MGRCNVWYVPVKHIKWQQLPRISSRQTSHSLNQAHGFSEWLCGNHYTRWTVNFAFCKLPETMRFLFIVGMRYFLRRLEQNPLYIPDHSIRLLPVPKTEHELFDMIIITFAHYLEVPYGSTSYWERCPACSCLLYRNCVPYKSCVGIPRNEPDWVHIF